MSAPIALTVGEPAGIGPDIILQLHRDEPDFFQKNNIIVIGNKKLLQERAEILGFRLNDGLSIIDIPLSEKAIPGKLNTRNASFVMDVLKHAAEGALEKKFSAIVTAPIQKSILNEAGFSIKGHTDFFARFTDCKTVMMLMTDDLKVALLTDHIPLKEVSAEITTDNITQCLDILSLYFQRILVCGLNPHAGENGVLGFEEKNVIIPALLNYYKKNIKLIGPIGADVAFTKTYREKADVILAMYHDQGLPVIKYSGFHDAVNVTLGLPFVRTSVDHGTALDIAGTGRANVMSLKKACLTAKSLFISHGHRTTDNG